MKPDCRTDDEAHSLRCEMATEVLRSSGHLRLKVAGWSMFPAVLPGDTLMIDRAASDEVSIGDIVLFGRNRRLFVHRVVGKNDAQFVTRGDAMPAADPAVDQNELLGRVTYILRDGRCIEPSKTRPLAERAAATLLRNSEIAARVVASWHSLRQRSVPTA